MLYTTYFATPPIFQLFVYWSKKDFNTYLWWSEEDFLRVAGAIPTPSPYHSWWIVKERQKACFNEWKSKLTEWVTFVFYPTRHDQFTSRKRLWSRGAKKRQVRWKCQASKIRTQSRCRWFRFSNKRSCLLWIVRVFHRWRWSGPDERAFDFIWPFAFASIRPLKIQHQSSS